MAESDLAILRYMQPPNMTPQKYAQDLVAEPYKVADVYAERTERQ